MAPRQSQGALSMLVCGDLDSGNNFSQLDSLDASLAGLDGPRSASSDDFLSREGWTRCSSGVFSIEWRAKNWSTTLRWSCVCACMVAVALLASPSPAAASRAAMAPVDDGGDPTVGFTEVSLNESTFRLQRPYDVPSNDRYSFHGGVRQLWVLSSDKPHSRNSITRPRTEISVDYYYSSGVLQFEGYGCVPSGTTGVSILQVFGAGKTATTLMLHVYDGALRYYTRQVVEDGIYDRWFRLNVVHDVGASTLTVYVDGIQKLWVPGRGGDLFNFKFGVYAQQHASSCMESRWKNVKLFRAD